MARLGVHSKLERQTLAALSYVLRRVIGRRLRILRRRPFYCICLLLRGRAFSITTLVWTPLDLQVMAKAVKQGGPMTCGWHKPRLRGRISTQACLVRRFTLSQEFNRNTSLSCCITLWDQRKLHHLCGPAGVRYCICLLFRGHAYCITALVWTPLDLQVMAKAVKQGSPMPLGGISHASGGASQPRLV
jgi:hypothetical protein